MHGALCFSLLGYLVMQAGYSEGGAQARIPDFVSWMVTGKASWELTGWYLGDLTAAGFGWVGVWRGLDGELAGE